MYIAIFKQTIHGRVHNNAVSQKNNQHIIFLSIISPNTKNQVFQMITSTKEVMFLPDFVRLSVCRQDNSKSYGQIFLKFSGNVGNGKNYQ